MRRDGRDESIITVFDRLAEEELMVDVLLCGDEGRFGKTLVVAGDFDLLTVFAYFLKVVVVGGEFLKFLFELGLHLGGNLIGTLSDDAYCFVHIAGLLGELNHVAGDGGHRSVVFLEFHLDLSFGEFVFTI